MTYEQGEMTVPFSGLGGERDARDSVIARAQAGDIRAFEALMREHEQGVLRTACLLLGNLQDAEDAAQEVFLRLHKYLHRFHNGGALGPWLYRITVNACRDLHRKRAKQPRIPLKTVPEEVLAGNQRPDNAAAALEEWDRIMTGLQTLSEKERQAFVLRDIEGLSTREVARTLGSTQVTVRSQISRARLKLKRFRDRFAGE